jgi:hypothetical protein
VKTAIAITLCSRPDYTRQVLNALSKCDDVDAYPIFLCCEPVSQEVIDAAKMFASLPHIHATVLQGTKRLGCNVNTYAAIAHGFSEADAVITLEDDTVPARDFLRFCSWGLKEYRNDPDVFSICGYQRTPLDEITYRSAVVRESWFTPWGWATWRDRWDSVRDTWPANDVEVSWDTVLDKMTRRNRCEVRPMLARIQNIGGEGGAHVPGAAWHREHHWNPHWFENVPGPRVDEWCEVPAGTTKALRAYAPC